MDTAYTGYWPDQPVTEPPRWTAGLDAIKRWISEVAPRGARSEIVVSDEYVRYLVLPWSSDLTDEAEWLALAKARIDLIWGSGVASDIRMERLRFNTSRLVCAMDQGLTVQLLALQASHGHTVTSIRPHFTVAFNALAGDIPPERTMIIISERQCLTIGAVEGGAWKHVRTIPISTDAGSVEPLVNRERLLLGLSADCTIVHGPKRDVARQRLNSAA
jgi:hypothetical protein